MWRNPSATALMQGHEHHGCFPSTGDMAGIRRTIADMSLIGRLARQPAPSEVTAQPPVRYDRQRQISEVFEDGRWVNSWDSRLLPGTKKADHETGEDQKGQ
jgi:hypothetical protein